jgi:hypothetical protein
MKQYVYFEAKPKGGHLDDACYEACSLTVGRPCVDVALLLKKKLILVKRSVPPGKGMWMAGGRIRWESFECLPQYASLTALEQFGIEVTTESMTMLTPRFICLEERPYPEVLLWVVSEISQSQFERINLYDAEIGTMLIFENKSEIETYIISNSIPTCHASIFLDLWDELQDLELVN